MPSKFSTAKLSCPYCGTAFDYRHWTKISGDDYPELKEEILSGAIFQAVCPKCNRGHKVIANMRYSDYSRLRNFFVYLVPEDMMEKERQFIESLGGLKKNGTRIHLAHSPSELQSIIKTYDSGLKYPESHIFQSAQGVAKSHQIHGALDQMVSELKTSTKPSLWKRLFGK